MRHARQRQLKKVNGIVENNRIDVLNKFNPTLDKTFKWHRELTIFRGTVSANRVSFNHSGEYKNIKTK